MAALKFQLVKELLFIFFTYLFLFMFYFHFQTVEWEIKILNDLNSYLSVAGLVIISSYLSRGEKLVTGWYRISTMLLAAMIGISIYLILT